jgi:hypothetical protein
LYGNPSGVEEAEASFLGQTPHAFIFTIEFILSHYARHERPGLILDLEIEIQELPKIRHMNHSPSYTGTILFAIRPGKLFTCLIL